MKRACIIITDADYVFLEEAWADRTTLSRDIEPTRQLLADLRTLARPWNSSVDVLVAARARLRRLLPEEEK